MPHRSITSLTSWFLAGVAALALPGCASLDLSKDLVWPWEATPAKPPAKFTDTWTFTVLRQPGLPPIRGFGGRVTFFDSQDKPMKVDGTFTVYAFDARTDNPMAALPERKFVFLEKDLARHHDKIKLGDSYSFWLPWGEVDGPQRQLTLIARFEAKHGQLVMGSASRLILSGSEPPAKKEAAAPPAVATAPSANRQAAKNPSDDGDGVRPASYQQEVSSQTSGDKRCVETIDVPPGFVRHSLSSPELPEEKTAGAAAEMFTRPASGSQVSGSSAATGAVKDAASGREAKSPKADSDATGEAESSTRFGPPRLQARKEAVGGPTRDPFRRTQLRGRWPTCPPSPPRPVPWRETQNTPADAPPIGTTSAPPAGPNTQN